MSGCALGRGQPAATQRLDAHQPGRGEGFAAARWQVSERLADRLSFRVPRLQEQRLEHRQPPLHGCPCERVRVAIRLCVQPAAQPRFDACRPGSLTGFALEPLSLANPWRVQPLRPLATAVTDALAVNKWRVLQPDRQCAGTERFWSEERNGEERAESKIKGGDSHRATFLGLHIGWRSTRQNTRVAAPSWNCESSQTLAACRLRRSATDHAGATP